MDLAGLTCSRLVRGGCMLLRCRLVEKLQHGGYYVSRIICIYVADSGSWG